MTAIAHDPGLDAWLRRLAPYLYLVNLVPGKRVLEVGCGTGYGARFLANHGAGHVLGVDPAPAAVAEALARHRQTNLDFRCEQPGSMELEDGSFEVIIVPSGVELIRRRSVLDELRRLLVSEGHLVVCGASADRRGAAGGAAFHELRDRLERLFAPVRMIAQAPLVGFSLVEYGDDVEDDAPGIQLDTSLLELGGGEPEACDYVAVCGGVATAPRPFTVVQLPEPAGVAVIAAAVGGPVASAAEEARAGDAPTDAALIRELRARVDTAVEDRARAIAQADAARTQAEDLRRLLADARRERAAPGAEAVARLHRLELELDGGRDLLREIEDGLTVLEREAGLAGGGAAGGPGGRDAERLREHGAELGVKDAEITILHVGVTALRARMRQLISEVRGAWAAMQGRDADEMGAIMRRLGERLAAYEERD